MPIAVGLGLAAQVKKTDQVAVCFFGDGASNEGTFHESLNLASVWHLPVIFVCENNHYAISTSVETSTATGTFYQRAAGYGVPGVLVNGNDVLEVYAAAKEAIDRARRGEGPSFIECDTYRLRGHHEGDEQTYRTRAEVEAVAQNNDCLRRMKQLLEEEFAWSEEDEQTLRKSVEDQVNAAVEFGLNGTPMKVEDMEKNLFVD